MSGIALNPLHGQSMQQQMNLMPHARPEMRLWGQQLCNMQTSVPRPQDFRFAQLQSTGSQDDANKDPAKPNNVEWRMHARNSISPSQHAWTGCVPCAGTELLEWASGRSVIGAKCTCRFAGPISLAKWPVIEIYILNACGVGLLARSLLDCQNAAVQV